MHALNFDLVKIDETRHFLQEELKHNDLMRK